jgi:hypothetical protein
MLKELVSAEDARRVSLETRSTTIVTVSGVLVTLLLALAGAVTPKDSATITHQSRGFLLGAVVAFTVAAALAALTYGPQRFAPYDISALAAEIQDLWYKPADVAQRKVIADYLEQLRLLQRANNLRGLLFTAAIATQILAITLLAAAVVLTLSG